MQNWLTSKVDEIHSQHGDSVVTLVLNQADLDAVSSSMVGAFAQQEHFVADLKMQKAVWFYHQTSHKRCLLAFCSKEEKDEMRKLAKNVAEKLQSKKTPSVHFVIGPALTHLASTFHSQFYMSNFEKTYKIESAQPKKSEEELKKMDPRALRLTKNAEKFEVVLENESEKDKEEYKFDMAKAHAWETAKSLIIVRGSEADPEYMEKAARKIAEGSDLVKEVRVLQSDQLVKEGMNLFYEVGKGAVCKPRCVMVHYVGRPEDAATVDVALVGKGITYDTGGLNIKGTGFMETMYGDKGGSCAVLGALKGCIEHRVKKNVVFACAFAENAIGADCFKPSDILRAMNGLSVEIGNTDAEGRLVLSDTMTYVQRNFNPKKVIYIATLTGAIKVALGQNTAGLFCNNEEMVKSLKEASESSQEAVWHMPLNDEHREDVTGSYGADLSNIGKSRWGGASHAAAFLERFVEDGRPWAHFDISGCCKATKPDQDGFGARLLLQYIYDKA